MGMFGSLFGGGYDPSKLRDQAYSAPAFNPMGTPIYGGAPQDVPIGVTGQMPNRPAFTSPSGMFGSPAQPQAGGWADKVGKIGAILSNLGGDPRALEAMQQQQQLAAQNAREDARLNKPQVHFGEDGSAYKFDPTTGQFSVLAQGTGKQGSIETNYSFFNKIDPTGKLAAQYAGQEAAGPPVMQVVNGQLMAIPRAAAAAPQGAGMSGPPPQAAAALKANPGLRDQFDAKYGPGASAQILGGAGPSQAPRTFP